MLLNQKCKMCECTARQYENKVGFIRIIHYHHRFLSLWCFLRRSTMWRSPLLLAWRSNNCWSQTSGATVISSGYLHDWVPIHSIVQSGHYFTLFWTHYVTAQKLQCWPLWLTHQSPTNPLLQSHINQMCVVIQALDQKYTNILGFTLKNNLNRPNDPHCHFALILDTWNKTVELIDVQSWVNLNGFSSVFHLCW